MALALGWTMAEVRQHNGWDLAAMMEAAEERERSRRRAAARRR